MSEMSDAIHACVLGILVGAAESERVQNVLDLHRLLERGLPGAAIGRLRVRYGFSYEELGELLGLETGTARWRQKQERLLLVETERLWRVTMILEEATRLLGSCGKARGWLYRPARALGSMRPLDMLSTEVGYTEAQNVLGRAEWGVWS